jgi:hypothetical protein
LVEFELHDVGFEGCFSERFASQRDPVMTLHETVEHRVGDGLVADPPMLLTAT